MLSCQCLLALCTGFASFPPLTGCFNPLAYKQVQFSERVGPAHMTLVISSWGHQHQL